MTKRVVIKTNSYPFKPVNDLLDKFNSLQSLKSSKRVWIIILVTGLLLLAFYKKSWFIAATVNGMPITNLELQTKLNQQFRGQILNQLVNEKIILDEARKGGAIPAESEIDQKIAELEANVGGKDTLDALLSQQGQTRTSLRDQIRIQLAITKIYEKQATVSADEVAKFIEENKNQLRATDSASQEKEAADILKQQKLSQIFNQKFQELRENAKIQIF